MKFLNLLFSLILILSLGSSLVKAQSVPQIQSSRYVQDLNCRVSTYYSRPEIYYTTGPDDFLNTNASLMRKMQILLDNYCDRYSILLDLLRQAIDINSSTPSVFPPLHAAAIHNNVPAVRLLLAFGADPNTSTEGGPAWLQFVDNRSVNRIHVFLDTGRVNVNDTFQDIPAICIIKNTRDNRLLQRMIDMGADPNEEC